MLTKKNTGNCSCQLPANNQKPRYYAGLVIIVDTVRQDGDSYYSLRNAVTGLLSAAFID